MESTYKVKGWATTYENNRTRELKRLEWVPVPNKMDGSGYNELVDHPNGAAHFGAWIAILEIASRQDVRGQLPQSSTGIAPALARISRLPLQLFEEVLPRLVSIGWIEPVSQQNQQPVVIPQEGATIPQASAELPALKGNRTRTEGEEETPLPADAGVVAEIPLAVEIYPPIGSWFDREFWPLWPVKENRKPAEMAAKSVRPAEYMAVISGLYRQRERIRSMDRPIHASTWLRARRWEDEALPIPVRTGTVPFQDLQQKKRDEAHQMAKMMRTFSK